MSLVTPRALSARISLASRGVAALVASGLFGMVGVACGDSTPPGGSGDTLVDDTRPQPRPPQNPDEGADSAAPDGDTSEASAIYPGITACDTCACSPDLHYCFGGATLRARRTRALASDAGAGEAAACPLPTAADGGSGDPGLSPVVGCNLLPKACTDCACIIAALQPAYACYLVCANDGMQMTVYCPNP